MPIDVNLCRSLLSYLGEIEVNILEGNKEKALEHVKFLKKEISALVECREERREQGAEE